MSDPYIGEIRMVPFNFAPKGWALCNGQLLAISQNQALFSLLGTFYGGDGRVTFGLPDLRGRMPVHFNGQFPIGGAGGESAHTLVLSEIPLHNHLALASSTAPDQPGPANDFWATGNGALAFGATPDGTMDGGVLTAAGGSQPHDNMPPYLVINFIIALFGIFPSRS